MRDPWRRGWLAILAAQIPIYALRLTDGFYDGRQHLNWGPPFFLLRAAQMLRVPFWTQGRAGLVTGTAASAGGRVATAWYVSHPQFVAIPLRLWTGAFGLAEWSPRALTACVTLATTALLWLAARERHGARRATLFAGLWASLPAVVVFGRNLEFVPFVTLGLALALAGHEKFKAGRRRWRWCWTAGIVVMLWSDWFAYPTAALFFAAQAAFDRALLWDTLGAGALATGLVLGQLAAIHAAARRALPAASRTSQTPVGYLWGQYRARSGSGEPWPAWAARQARYWSVNFGWGTGAAALAGGLLAQVRGRFGELTLRRLLFLAAAGNLAYALIVRDASFVHLFYQYPYSLWVAWELAELLERGAERLARPLFAPLAWAAVIGALLYQGISLLYSPGWGGPAEMELLKLIKSYPPESSVTMIAPPQDNWLAMPNVEYYAGRRIWNAYPEDAARGDLVLLAPGDLDAQKSALDLLAGPRYRFLPKACAPALCLWERGPI